MIAYNHEEQGREEQKTTPPKGEKQNDKRKS